MKKLSLIVIVALIMGILTGCMVRKYEGTTVLQDASFIENENYTVEFPFSVVKADNIMSISGNIQCSKPEVESPGTMIMSGLPVSTQEIFVTVAERNGNGRPARVYVDKLGNIYLRYGAQDGLYDISVMYFTDSEKSK